MSGNETTHHSLIGHCRGCLLAGFLSTAQAAELLKRFVGTFFVLDGATMIFKGDGKTEVRLPYICVPPITTREDIQPRTRHRQC